MKSFLYLTTCILMLTTSPTIAAGDDMSEDDSLSSTSQTVKSPIIGEKHGRDESARAAGEALPSSKIPRMTYNFAIPTYDDAFEQ